MAGRGRGRPERDVMDMADAGKCKEFELECEDKREKSKRLCAVDVRQNALTADDNNVMTNPI
jgi:hypothetical protein